jgi:hypothetical protein
VTHVDELDLLRQLRDRQAAPTPEQRTRARDRLLVQVRTTAPARPDGTERVTPRIVVSTPAPAVSWSPPRWRRRFAPVLSALVVVVVLASVVVWVGSSVVGPPLPLIDRGLPGADIDVPEEPLSLEVHRGIDLTGDPQLLADGVYVDVVAPTVPGRWPAVLLLTNAEPHAEYESFARGIAEHGVVVHVLRTSSGTRTVTTRMVADTLATIACGLRHTRATTTNHGGVPETTTVVAFGADAPIAILTALRSEEVQASPCTVRAGTVRPAAVVAMSSGLTGCLALVCEGTDQGGDPAALDPLAHVDRSPDVRFHFLLPGHGDIGHDGLHGAERLAEAMREAGREVEWTVLSGASPGDLYLEGRSARDEVVARVVEIARG